MAKAYKELKLIKARFIEGIDELIAQYKEEGLSTDEVHFDDLEEDVCQILSDIFDESEGDWKISF